MISRSFAVLAPPTMLFGFRIDAYRYSRPTTDIHRQLLLDFVDWILREKLVDLRFWNLKTNLTWLDCQNYGKIIRNSEVVRHRKAKISHMRERSEPAQSAFSISSVKYDERKCSDCQQKSKTADRRPPTKLHCMTWILKIMNAHAAQRTIIQQRQQSSRRPAAVVCGSWHHEKNNYFKSKFDDACRNVHRRRLAIEISLSFHNYLDLTQLSFKFHWTWNVIDEDKNQRKVAHEVFNEIEIRTLASLQITANVFCLYTSIQTYQRLNGELQCGKIFIFKPVNYPPYIR